MAESQSSSLAGPERLGMRQTSSWGPFAALRRQARLALDPARFSITNSGPSACTIATIGLDPLRRAEAGTVAGAALDLHSDRLTAPLASGDHLVLDLDGTVPAQPGAYATNVRVSTVEGASLSIPVAIEISASMLWGIGCMALGLVSLGVIDFLAGEGEIKSRLHNVLAARQEIHALLEVNPPPQSRSGDVEAMDRSYDAAVTTLDQHHRLSIVDHRVAVSDAEAKAANDIAGQLRRDLVGRPLGVGEVTDLDHEAADLQALLQRIGSLSAGAPAPSAPAPGLAGRLDAFLARYRLRMLQQPIGWIADETASELARVHLAYAAGEGDSASNLASTARRWLRRSARSLNSALAGYRGALVLAGSMVGTDGVLRERVARADFPADVRVQVLAMLDAAAADMNEEAWLPQWAAAHEKISNAQTAYVRGAAETMKLRFSDAMAAVNAETDTGDVERLSETLLAGSDHSVEAKQAGFNRILDLWRAHIAKVEDKAARDTLQATVDQTAKAVASGDMAATSPLYKELIQSWTDWSTRLTNQTKDKLDHRQCLDLYADLQRDTGAIEAGLRERLAGPETAEWDRRLDLIRLDMQRHGPDAQTVTENCAGPLLDLDKRTIDLSGEILTTAIADLEVPALTRVRLARASGLPGAIAIAEANDERARTLDIVMTTPAAERIVGRPLAFSIAHMDPVWGAGVTVRVDFGDGSPPFLATAEQLRQGRAVVHDYAAPLTHRLSVVAIENLPTVAKAANGHLGQGMATILIAPSPVSDAERLADDFLTLRFGLALLIALVVYYWRYQNKTVIFGARSFDYVEAFALGFAANAAALKLPEVMAKFAAM